jgi:hypothetical protein
MNRVAKNETGITWASGVNLVLGLWLFVSAWAVASQASAARSGIGRVG